MKKIFAYTAIRKFGTLVARHKALSFTAAILLALAGYWGVRAFGGNGAETRYVLAAVTRGTIIVSVGGSGQVSASNEVDIKPKVSGDVVSLNTQNGGEVKAGTIIIQLDARDAEKAVRDAEANLQSARLSLKKIEQPADVLSLLRAENALAQAKESKTNAEDNLATAYEDAFNTISNGYLDFPGVMSGLQDVLYASSAGLGGSGTWNIDYYASAAAQYDERANQFKADANRKYQTARRAYDTNFQAYKSASRFSDTAVIVSLLDETHEAAKNIAEAVKSANNLIQFYEDKLIEHNARPATLADTHLASLNSSTGKTNTHLLNLLGARNAIQSDRDAIVNADRAIAENAESLAKLKAGAEALDLESARLTVRQRENALLDVREKLGDYFIRAPFDGTIAKLNVKKSDAVSGGTAVATLITKQKLAELSLNEVDVAKVAVGQKTTLAFDAIEGLSISGAVAEIDSIGAVTQGVVTYGIKISFDTQDDRVKSGMSVSADIITDVRQDALTVPNSAVKAQGDAHYVEVVDAGIVFSGTANGEARALRGGQGVTLAAPPRRQEVVIGISNDTATEIVSGLTEGARIVSRTVTDSATQSASPQAPSLFGAPGAGGGFRMPR